MRPPVENGKVPAQLVDLAKLEPGVRLDIRYATARNFLGTPVYTSARALMDEPAAGALVRAHRTLAASGYGLLIHDAYRPWYVTKIFWEATRGAQRGFVADPAKGSMHNRGCAVDLTMYELKTGRAVTMPSLYDEMSARAYVAYAGGREAERVRRDVLRRAMEGEGYTVNPSEWWHFDFRGCVTRAIGNLRFEELP